MSTPETFEAHGGVWTKHTPGDPCPCEAHDLIEVITQGELATQWVSAEEQGSWWTWDKVHDDPLDEIIGWRFAEPAAPPVEEKDELPADWSKDSSLETWFPFTAQELATLREEKAAMLTAIQSASSSFTHIDEHPSDFTSPELFYWNAKNQCRAALATLRPYLP